MKTVRQARGTNGENAAVAYLTAQGWRVLGRNIELAGVEVDIVGVDPGPPSTIVVVEVRSARSSKYGAPEDNVDRRKVARLYRALADLRHAEGLATDAMAHAVRVDLLVVDLRGGSAEMRHLRALEPA